MCVAPTSTITDVSGLEAESSEFTLSTDSYCAASAIQVNVTNSDGTIPATVSSVNSTNGTVSVNLSSPLDKSLDGSTLQFTLTQCSVASTVFESAVGDDDDDDSGSDSSSGSTTNGSTANAGNGYSNAGKESTQESNSKTGLSGGLIIGIAVGVVAACGFVFECWYHKRRQAPSHPSTNDGQPVPHGYGNNAI